MSILTGPGVRVPLASGAAAADTATNDQTPVVIQATSGQTADLWQLQNSAGTIVGRNDLQGRQYGGGGSAPGAAAGANNGGSPPAPVVTAGDTDIRGNITFGSGSAPAAGAQCVVTFANAWKDQNGNNTTPFVMVAAKNTATQALGLYVSGVSATGFTLSTTSAPAASQANTVYSFDYVAQG